MPLDSLSIDANLQGITSQWYEYCTTIHFQSLLPKSLFHLYHYQGKRILLSQSFVQAKVHASVICKLQAGEGWWNLAERSKEILCKACEEIGMSHANIFKWKIKFGSMHLKMCALTSYWEVITVGAQRERALPVNPVAILLHAAHLDNDFHEKLEKTMFCCAEICQISWICAQVENKSLTKRSLWGSYSCQKFCKWFETKACRAMLG